MNDAAGAVFLWLAIIEVGVAIGMWINRHAHFDFGSALAVYSVRGLIFLLSFVFAFAFVIMAVELAIAAMY